MKLSHCFVVVAQGVLIGFALLSVACTAGFGKGYAFASVGGDASKVSATSGGLTITNMNNSKAFDSAKRLAGEVVTAGVIKTGIEATPKILRSTGDAVKSISQ